MYKPSPISNHSGNQWVFEDIARYNKLNIGIIDVPQKKLTQNTRPNLEWNTLKTVHKQVNFDF